MSYSDDPIFAIDGLLYSVQIESSRQIYSLDAENTTVTTGEKYAQLECYNFILPHPQQRLAGLLTLDQHRIDNYTTHFTISAYCATPIQRVSLVLRNFPSGTFMPLNDDQHSSLQAILCISEQTSYRFSTPRTQFGSQEYRLVPHEDQIDVVLTYKPIEALEQITVPAWTFTID